MATLPGGAKIFWVKKTPQSWSSLSHHSPTCINLSQDLQQHAMEITCLIITTCLFFLRTFSWSTPYKCLLHLNISFNLWKWSLISRGTKLLRYYFSLKWTEKVLLQPSNPPSHTAATQMSTTTQANFRQIRRNPPTVQTWPRSGADQTPLRRCWLSCQGIIKIVKRKITYTFSTVTPDLPHELWFLGSNSFALSVEKQGTKRGAGPTIGIN